MLALPLDAALRRLEAQGHPSRTVPYLPPRVPRADIVNPARWRVAAVRGAVAGLVELVAVPAGEEAVRLCGERGPRP